jgi:hypothetical protein
MAVTGIIFASLPFFFSVFPIHDFWAWIYYHINKDSPSQFAFKYFRNGLIYVSAVLFYFFASRWSEKKHSLAEKLYFGLFLACLLATLFPATKVGAGTYYFYPFLAILVDQILRHSVQVIKYQRQVWCLFGVLTATLLIISIPTQKRYFRALNFEDTAAIKSEISLIMETYPDRTIEMGFGSNITNYSRTFHRTMLVMAGHPYTLDAAPAMELNMWKVPLPKASLAMIRECNTDIWLIPSDEVPFQMVGYYGAPTLDPVFKKNFLASYKKLKTFEYFDMWVCK